MKMIKAVVRPEKAGEVLAALNSAGYRAASRISILGRGKQMGLKVGEVYYDEVPKEMIIIVVNDGDVKTVEKLIADTARTGKKGAFGDGKIFVVPVERAVTISSGEDTL